jgi:hypothetical protein
MLIGKNKEKGGDNKMPIEEVVFSFAQIGLSNPLAQAFVIGGIRALGGWLQHAFEDGKITWPELKELGASMLRVLPQVIGLTALGVPAVGALITDVFVTKAAKIADKK